jgi:hypothetical protein
VARRPARIGRRRRSRSCGTTVVYGRCIARTAAGAGGSTTTPRPPATLHRCSPRSTRIPLASSGADIAVCAAGSAAAQLRRGSRRSRPPAAPGSGRPGSAACRGLRRPHTARPTARGLPVRRRARQLRLVPARHPPRPRPTWSRCADADDVVQRPVRGYLRRAGAQFACAYRAGAIDQPDNRALRAAYALQTPLVYSERSRRASTSSSLRCS